MRTIPISALLISVSTLLSAQNTPEPQSQFLLLSAGSSSPQEALVNSADLQTRGKGYRNPGIRLSVSHGMLHHNQGFIQTLFYNQNSFNTTAFAQDCTQDVSPSIATGGTWKTFGMLCGYYRQFPFNAKQSLLIDMSIQAGLIYGNSPETEVRYDFSPYQYQDIVTREAWGAGMMGLTGFGLDFRPAEGYGLRLGFDVTAGQIQQVAERTQQDLSPSPYNYSTVNDVSVLHTQYWTINVTLGLQIRL